MILISTLLVAALAAHQNGAPAWSWALYESEGLVLAREVPDTARLDATFECAPGSNVAILTLYEGAAQATGYARLGAGEANATAEVQPAPRGARRMTVRTDHPVFVAFAADGDLALSAGALERTLTVPQNDLAKLRRFAELCTG